MPGLTVDTEIPDKIFDILVIGLGPAGVACVLQAFRDGLTVLAVGDEPVGGLVRAARRITNLPAQSGISGEELAKKMQRQLRDLGIPMLFNHVTDLVRHQDGFSAGLAGGRKLRSRTVCLATGTRPRDWDRIVGGQVLHRDARSLPESLSGAKVVVVGGGEAALDTALNARDRGGKVTVLARGEKLQSVPRLFEECRQAGVAVRLQTRVERVAGGPGSWVLTCQEGGVLETDLLVVCIGRVPRDDLLQEMLPRGFEPKVVQEAVPGLTLAGDLIRGRERYLATAMGDGQQAAIAAAFYLAEET